MIAKSLAFALLWVTFHLASSQTVLADVPCSGNGEIVQADLETGKDCCDTTCDDPCDMNCATSSPALCTVPTKLVPPVAASPSLAMAFGAARLLSDPPRRPPRII